MTTADLMDDLNRRGIRLKAHGDRLRYYPRRSAAIVYLYLSGQNLSNRHSMLRDRLRATAYVEDMTGWINAHRGVDGGD